MEHINLIKWSKTFPFDLLFIVLLEWNGLIIVTFEKALLL